MTLIINNDDVRQLLTMHDTMAVLEQSYLDLAAGKATCRPRIDIRIPSLNPAENYQFGSMEGGRSGDYFAVRMKSDMIYECQHENSITQEKYCVKRGLFCGLILLTSVNNAAPLAFINDGVLQHMRVAADGGIGVKYMACPDAKVVGMLGSGGMARAHMQAFMSVRPIKRLQVYSPTCVNRDAFAREMTEVHGLEVELCDRPELVYQGADIVAALTDSAVPVLDGRLLEKGTHVVNIGGGGMPDVETMRRVDVYLRFGDAPAPIGHPEWTIDDEYLGWEAGPGVGKYGDGRMRRKGRGAAALPARRVGLTELVNGSGAGRVADDQITWSERGNLQGAQFYAVAGHVYELAVARGLGRDIPTEWFLQDVRD